MGKVLTMRTCSVCLLVTLGGAPDNDPNHRSEDHNTLMILMMDTLLRIFITFTQTHWSGQ